MKRVLKTVAVAFIIALILILIKNEYARCLPASTYGMQAAIRKERVDNLFIGSSMFRQGLDIDVLEAELPGSSYILSYNGNQPALMALELQYMLEQGLQEQFLAHYRAALDDFFPGGNLDQMARMVSRRHFEEKKKLLAGQNAAIC